MVTLVLLYKRVQKSRLNVISSLQKSAPSEMASMVIFATYSAEVLTSRFFLTFNVSKFFGSYEMVLFRIIYSSVQSFLVGEFETKLCPTITFAKFFVGKQSHTEWSIFLSAAFPRPLWPSTLYPNI